MSTSIPDQKAVWDAKHGKGDHEKLREIPSPFARVAEPYFSRGSYILEIGCGVGRDAMYFASKGHDIVATDGSEVVTRQNQQQIHNESVAFDVVDMQRPLPYGDASFDAVFANLSLHYYSDAKTREIVAEVARVLKSGGLFAFACKSYDELHNQGKEVEQNIFVSPKGVVVHLFSKAYAQGLIEKGFKLKYLEEVGEEYNGRFSKIVRCIAEKEELA